ncbi:hypothetical protein KAZ01_03995, partial [Candidatus Gracilibacteria bacterium]|nr:hypothetical protein [Candidatus Gracilibacteria bacterium]
MEAASDTTIPITSTKEVQETKDIRDDLDYFKSLVEGNKKEDFFVKGKDKEYRDGMLKADYKFFTKKITMYKESVGDDYLEFSDFDFMEIYLTKIFTSLYTDRNLNDVFENNEIKEKFFNCMKKYFFGNFGSINIELVKKYPREIMSGNEVILTKDEIRCLLE